jgi:hypothetical protein
MTDEAGRVLRERLARLAAAVPVADPRSDPAARVIPAMPALQSVRRSTWASAASGLSPVSLVALAVVAILGTGLLATAGLGPFRRTDAGTIGPVSATTTEGDFSLTIRSPKGRYAADEAISVTATLAYGPSGAVGIAHGLGVDDGPLSFSVDEPIFGNLHLSGAIRMACRASTLTHDAPIEARFGKSGGFDGNDPQASAFIAYMQDPVFRLPPGTWHVRVSAGFSIGSCGDDRRYNLSAAIAIVVPDASGAILPAVTPGPSIRPGDRPVGDDTQDGPIALTLTAPHGEYRAGDPITVTAGLTNGGSDGSITTYGSSSVGPVAFSLRQLDGPVTMTSTGTIDCVEQVTLPLYQPLEVPFKKGSLSGTEADPAYWAPWASDPVLRLPAGTWEIAATPAFSTDPGCATPGPSLRPTITITVLP